ncbi:MAG: hypothetical protein J5I99_07100 [Verrucomicrobia bacterium]|nr:hypothetical protein [Verrucomicrobiota bacterium]
MKPIRLAATVAGVGLMLGAGCDWSSQGTSLNTSQGAGVTINFSGVYNGNISGRAVDRTSAGTISRLTIRQSGNRVEVVDSQGSHYEGSVGAPGLVASPTDGEFPAGAELMQSQISWAGKDGVAQREVEFVGIIHAISVEDISGTSKKNVSESTNEKSDNYTYTVTTTYTTNATSAQVITRTERAYDGDGNLVFEEVTETTIPASAGDVKTTTRTVVDNRGKKTTNTVTTDTTYRITEQNVQYRLEGTWIEKNSPIVSRVDAISRGASGTITSTSSSSSSDTTTE